MLILNTKLYLPTKLNSSFVSMYKTMNLQCSTATATLPFALFKSSNKHMYAQSETKTQQNTRKKNSTNKERSALYTEQRKNPNTIGTIINGITQLFSVFKHTACIKADLFACVVVVCMYKTTIFVR